MADEDVIFEVHECLPCAICGHTVHYEFSVPNSVWNAVMRQDGHETDAEYICLSCFFTVLTTAITALQAENERLTKQLDEAEADAERLAKELAAANKHLCNIADLGVQRLPVDKRWGTAHAIAMEAVKRIVRKEGK